MSINIETAHFVNGVNIVDLSPTALIDIIVGAEKEIKSLSAVQTESTAITGQIEALKEGKDVVAKFLDAKV